MTPCKKVGQNTYYYVPCMPPSVRAKALKLALEHNIESVRYTVVKLGPDTFSFLDYPWFGSDPFPALAQSWTVRLSAGTVRHATYDQRDAPILHRKELLLPETHKIYAKCVKMTKRCEEAGLFKDTKRIGRKKVWAEMLRKVGIPWVSS